eukprot:CAMPEP_0176488714 /NCGR_PEP_ID=MMETSP0200_2-20121128/6868_1 /TAXON_ID=947934 /ORGANISM="Chaetoceros sp., Strain GSL56" /LENGTH=957 /DNA_ID=CAMNT_0017885739 /DNA_START=340 /DNA_END=3216 /DNA_ORIENTATION=-
MTETKQEVATVGARAAVVRGLKVLTSPDEGGTKKDYEDFLEKIYHHIIISWQWGKDIGHVLKYGTDPDIKEPEDLDPAEEQKKWKTRLWEQEVDRYGLRMSALDGNKEALYALIIESLSSMVKSKLRGKVGYAKSEEETDPVWLLAQLDDIMARFEEVKPKLLAIDDQMQRIMNLRQGEATNEEFIKTVTKELKVYEKHGGDFLWGTKQKDDLWTQVNESKEKYLDLNGMEMPDSMVCEQTRLIKKKLRDEIIATAILKRADKKRYGNLQIQMKNSFLMGNNIYPSTVPDVLRILDNYEKEWPSNSKPQATENNTEKKRTGVAFTLSQGGAITSYLRGTNNSFYPAITCNICGIKGHYQSHCPACDKEGSKLEEGEKKTAEAAVEKESTDHIFCNDKLVTDVHVVTDGEGLRLYSSGGHLDSIQKGKFGDFTVWFNSQSLANILSLSQVVEKYRVTLDTLVENAFHVHISEGHILKFHCGPSGFVSDNMRLFKKREVKKAQDVMEFNRKINNQSSTKLTRIVKDNLVRNAPFTVGDVQRSEVIYGPQVPSLKGRTRDKQSARIPTMPILQIPKALYDNLKHVTLCVDFHFVNSVTVFQQFPETSTTELSHLHLTQAHTNTMMQRTIGAIVLGPRRIQGQYNYMSLETGDQIDGRVVAVLPPTEDVIERVETLGQQQKQPYRASRMLQYEWQPGLPIDRDDLMNDDDQPDPVPMIIPPTTTQPIINDNHNATINHLRNNSYAILADTDDDDDMDENQGATDTQTGINSDDDSAPNNIDDTHLGTDQGAAQDQGAHHPYEQDYEQDNGPDNDDDVSINSTSHEIHDDSSDNDTEETETKERKTERERRSQHFVVNDTEEYGRGKRTGRPRQWSFLQTKFTRLSNQQRREYLSHALSEYTFSGSTNLLMRYMTGVTFAQMTAARGIKKYGREAEIKLLAEFQQLVDYKTFHGRQASELTP